MKQLFNADTKYHNIINEMTREGSNHLSCFNSTEAREDTNDSDSVGVTDDADNAVNILNSQVATAANFRKKSYGRNITVYTSMLQGTLMRYDGCGKEIEAEDDETPAVTLKWNFAFQVPEVLIGPDPEDLEDPDDTCNDEIFGKSKYMSLLPKLSVKAPASSDKEDDVQDNTTTTTATIPKIPIKNNASITTPGVVATTSISTENVRGSRSATAVAANTPVLCTIADISAAATADTSTPTKTGRSTRSSTAAAAVINTPVKCAAAEVSARSTVDTSASTATGQNIIPTITDDATNTPKSGEAPVGGKGKGLPKFDTPTSRKVKGQSKAMPRKSKGKGKATKKELAIAAEVDRRAACTWEYSVVAKVEEAGEEAVQIHAMLRRSPGRRDPPSWKEICDALKRECDMYDSSGEPRSAIGSLKRFREECETDTDRKGKGKAKCMGIDRERGFRGETYEEEQQLAEAEFAVRLKGNAKDSGSAKDAGEEENKPSMAKEPKATGRLEMTIEGSDAEWMRNM
jgi:hypothetical protein